jgi:hypothetical protein
MSLNCPEAPQSQYIVEQNKENPRYMKLLGSWFSWFSSLTAFLKSYLTSFGINPPQITKEERDRIASPQNGSFAFITTDGGVDVNELQIYINGDWYKFDLTIAP